jgi:predicted ATPase
VDEPLLLRALRLAPPPAGDAAAFPFSVPAVGTLGELRLPAAITFFAGENGSGKSTVLEAIAIAAALPAAGSEGTGEDRTLEAQRRLAARLTLTWSRRTHRGFFLRAEDFFGFTKRMRGLRGEMLDRLAELDRDPEMRGASEWAMGLAKGPARGSLAEMEHRYGGDLDARSHGEGFLDFFRARMVPRGLYLLDEPEAALSPQSQLGLLAMMKDAVEQGSQLIVATHSPILMAAPDSAVLSFDRTPVAVIGYDELESVALYRDFLAAPARYLRHL